MPSNYITPNMFLIEPAIGVSLSPNWAQLLNADMGIIDSHNHTPGSGVQIPPSGLNINANLTIQGNSLIAINSLVFNGAVTGANTDLSLYTNGTDLFYTDSVGTQIQLTKNHQPNTSTGNIQGLPSTPNGGAGVSWINATSTFVFSQDSGSPGANIDAGTLIIRYPGSYPSPTGNYIALEAPSTLATGYAITLPAGLPANVNLVTLSPGGQLAGVVPDGSTIQIAGGVLELATQNTNHSSFVSSFITNIDSPPQQVASVTLTTNGMRSVLLTVNGTSSSGITATDVGNAGAVIQLTQDGSEVSRVVFGSGTSPMTIPPSSIMAVVATPSAGLHTYALNFSVAYPGTLSVNNITLTATQL